MRVGTILDYLLLKSKNVEVILIKRKIGPFVLLALMYIVKS